MAEKINEEKIEKVNTYTTLVRSFKNSVGFVDHQIKSFDEFVEMRVQKIIDEIGEIQLETPDMAEFKIKLGKVRIPQPSVKEADGAMTSITPMEARIRDLTYSSPLYVEMIPVINDVEQEPQEVKLGDLPIMLKSKLCVLNGKDENQLIEAGEDPSDPGGYFIINGTERVIVMVEEVLSNTPIVEIKGGIETARINSEASGFVQRHQIERKGGIVTISFANLKKLPVVVLLRALGMKMDKEIVESISTDKAVMQEIYFNLYEFDVKDVDDAKEFIGNKLKIAQKEYRDKRVNDILDKYLLPHLGQNKKNRMDKALYIAKVVRKVIKTGIEGMKEQDIDHYGNKRLKQVGDFMEILFRSILLGKYGLVSRIIYSYQKLVKRGKMPSIKSIVESDYLTKRIISHMATGQWIGGRTGVCQRLERTNYARTVAHIRNVISPLSSTQEHFEARALHATHWGRLCAEETPEGVNIGLRKYLALMAVISETTREKDKAFIDEVVKKEIPGDVIVFRGGCVLGTTTKPLDLVEKLRAKRRSGAFSPFIGVSYDTQFDEVHINTDSGRLMRPLIVVENGKPVLTGSHIEKLRKDEMSWNDLLKEGVIEYIDAEEENNALVALDAESLTKDHTHMEIDSGIILGLSASLVPFATHNRGDRVNFGAKMSGQALSIFSTNYLMRTDTKSDVLIYPQVPLVSTVVGREINMDDHPHGQNIVLAVMSFGGYNMEDGIVINKAAIERGFGRSFFFRNYTTEEKKYWGIEKDEIKIPDKSVNGYRTEEAYANLEQDGIVSREISVESGDVLIGKVSPLRFFGPVESFMVETENRRETSETIRHGEEGVVDNVVVTETASGNKLIKITVRSERVPEPGDKFTSRHGQKGVIALVVPEEDMPFTANGVTPDIILNPHAIPSRMTIGQLLEVVAAKVAAMEGLSVDGSAFNEVTEESLRDALKNAGFRDDGKETMYNGTTGKMMEAQILVGPCYYQKLHHMVANKLQVRSRGPVTLLTKQPTAGRSKQGGLRLGEMEKDCLIAHGASLLLKERFNSDKYRIPICGHCGLIAIEDFVKGKKYCPVCKKSKILDVDMSYAFKLMLDELKCMGIVTKINVEGEGTTTIKSLEFGFLSPKTIKDMSAIKIEHAELYDPDGYPIDGGLTDLHLGVVDPGLRCRTCGGTIGQCLGHFGYLELIKPVVHPLYGKKIYTILRDICRECSKPLATDEEVNKMKNPLTELYKKKVSSCPHCGAKQKEIEYQKPTSYREGKVELTTEEVRQRLERMTDEDIAKMKIKGGRPEWFILTILPIPPVTVRPSITLETGERSEDDITHKLVDVVRINERLKKNLEIGAPDFIIADIWELLQYHVSTLMSNEISTLPPARHRSGRALKTLMQRLSKKEGRFRGNLSGKRVNFSARTVISPDPLISMNEIGVPLEIAKELTVPIKVNKNNIEDAKKFVLNGPNVHPGANYISRPDNVRKKITDENRENMAAEIDAGYIVERHLCDGDITIINRQPSLHRMSMMAHRARIMPFRTIRLPLSVTIPYNADFDGDEMNLHVPQTEEAQSEAEMLMTVEKNIRSPRYGLPIITSKHDQITGAYLLTKDDTKFTKQEAARLFFLLGIDDFKVKEEYTGKEIFSSILPNDLNAEFKTSIGEYEQDQEYAVIKKGTLVKGVIDDDALGEKKAKLIDLIERKYGSETARKFIDNISRLSLDIITNHGFSVSISDLDMNERAQKKIEAIIDEHGKNAEKAIRDYKAGRLERLPGMTAEMQLESTILQMGGVVTDQASEVVTKNLPRNSAVTMAITGARGSFVNLTQMCALVGQEALEGERIHRGFVNRTLSHFSQGDIGLMSCGFVSSGYKRGLTPFEFFFDAMNSRENLMDKSLHTRHSGYMERRLVNALHDLTVEYDGTVRDSKKRIVQFVAGEDGIDPAKSDGGKVSIENVIQ
jgi:DNA-directed RNA polymerase subunit B